MFAALFSCQGAILETPRLLYFVDAMCSWCYGFAPQMEMVRAHFEDRLEYLTFSGGLRPFTKEAMDPAFQAKLADTYARISEVSGQPFGHTPSMVPGFIYDTEPASRAIVTMRHLMPSADYSYMMTIQRAFYALGQDITREDVLAVMAAEFDVAEADFLTAFRSDAMREATLGDFKVAQNLGIDGFPTLLIHKETADGSPELIMVGKGYGPAADVIAHIEMALEQDAFPAIS